MDTCPQCNREARRFAISTPGPEGMLPRLEMVTWFCPACGEVATISRERVNAERSPYIKVGGMVFANADHASPTAVCPGGAIVYFETVVLVTSPHQG